MFDRRIMKEADAETGEPTLCYGRLWVETSVLHLWHFPWNANGNMSFSDAERGAFYVRFADGWGEVYTNIRNRQRVGNVL